MESKSNELDKFLYEDLDLQIGKKDKLDFLEDEKRTFEIALTIIPKNPFSPLDSKHRDEFRLSLERNRNQLCLFNNFRQVKNELVETSSKSSYGAAMGNCFGTSKETIGILKILVEQFIDKSYQSKKELPVILDPFISNGMSATYFRNFFPDFRVHNGLHIVGNPISHISAQRFCFCSGKERRDYQEHLRECNIQFENIQVMYFNMRYSDREDIPHILEFLKCMYRYNKDALYFIVCPEEWLYPSSVSTKYESNLGNWISSKRCSVFEIRRIMFVNPVSKKETSISKRVVVITNIPNLNCYENIPEELRTKINPYTNANINRICKESASRDVLEHQYRKIEDMYREIDDLKREIDKRRSREEDLIQLERENDRLIDDKKQLRYDNERLFRDLEDEKKKRKEIEQRREYRQYQYSNANKRPRSEYGNFQQSYQQPSLKPSYQQPSLKPSYQQPSLQPSYQQPSLQQSYQQSLKKPIQKSFQPPLPPPMGEYQMFNNSQKTFFNPVIEQPYQYDKYRNQSQHLTEINVDKFFRNLKE